MHKLTALAVKNAQARDKSYKIADGGGLFLVVEKDGRRWWRLRYYFEGKERAKSLGTFPKVSLADARKKRDRITRLVDDGVDPIKAKKARQETEASAPTLASVAQEWLSKQSWESNYREKVQGRLQRHILPQLGHRPVTEITPPELLKALQRIEEAGTIETARRCKQHVSRVYKYAIAAGIATSDPASGLEEAMVAKPRPKHFAAITDPEELGQALRAMHGLNQATPQVQGALKLLPLLLLRPGELVSMEWEHWRERRLWEIPAEKMKMRQPHIVPLPNQAIAILEAIRPWAGDSKYVFPSARSKDRHMTVEALTASLRRIGLSGEEVTAHGFRATARTLLDEKLKYRPDYIEQQLAHQIKDPNGRAYNRTAHIEERTAMLQHWADYLDGLRTSTEKPGSVSRALSRSKARRRGRTATSIAGLAD